MTVDIHIYFICSGPYIWQCLLCNHIYKVLNILQQHIYNEHKMSAALLTRNVGIWQLHKDNVHPDELEALKQVNGGRWRGSLKCVAACQLVAQLL